MAVTVAEVAATEVEGAATEVEGDGWEVAAAVAGTWAAAVAGESPPKNAPQLHCRMCASKPIAAHRTTHLYYLTVLSCKKDTSNPAPDLLGYRRIRQDAAVHKPTNDTPSAAQRKGGDPRDEDSRIK